jgi:uncharacterized spore protein YtfJ
MSDIFQNLGNVQGRSQEDATELVGRLFEVTKPGVVFSEPVTAEGRTIITASEVSIGMGIGFGLGGGSGTAAGTDEEEPADEPEQVSGVGIGGGGGGGGGASGRPVAVIIMGPNGVRVEPVVDATKLGLAALTAFGGILAMVARMRKVGKR